MITEPTPAACNESHGAAVSTGASAKTNPITRATGGVAHQSTPAADGNQAVRNVSSLASAQREGAAGVGLTSYQVSLTTSALLDYASRYPSLSLDARIIASAFRECRRIELHFGPGFFDEPEHA